MGFLTLTEIEIGSTWNRADSVNAEVVIVDKNEVGDLVYEDINGNRFTRAPWDFQTRYTLTGE